MTAEHGLILGIIQGLGEFLPISSSAHLALLPKFFGWDYQGLDFDVALHLGTLAALAFYFRKEWAQIISKGFRAPSSGEGSTLWLLVLATIPAGLAGVLLHKQVETAFREPAYIAVALMVFALILYYADRKASSGGARFGLKNALIIGAAQALALAPGVSRSGITITAALLLGFSRAESAKISFLLSAPVIAGAALMEAGHFPHLGFPLLVGFAAAAVSGWLAVKFLLDYLKKYTLGIFVIYRLALGAAILLF